MKNKTLTIIIILGLVLILLGTGLVFAQSKNNSEHIDINTLPKYDLTSEQIETITFMFEEEKLARDVYRYLGEVWDLNVFKNITKSEQNHMDEVEQLLLKYEIEYVEKEAGIFTNADLQRLYDNLILKGEKSIKDALEVGINIEKVDIEDLEKALQNATPDMEYVFKNLLEGSYRHLEAFEKNLERSENSNYGQGNGDGNGQGNGQGNNDGNGQGNGQGNGDGNGQGNGQGNNDGNGQGNGQGNGDGNGQGNGQGNNDGNGNGNGQGNGDGNGNGNGQGNGKIN